MTRLLIRMISLFALVYTPASYAQNCFKEGFLPPNKLRIEARAVNNNGMTESIYNAILDRIVNYYNPVMTGLGAHFDVQRLWSDSTVNAYAERNGSTWSIKMYGGLARHSLITEDAFTLVACHEVGHHMGGAPKYAGQWAANEGEADYYSTIRCLRNIWNTDDNVSVVKSLKLDPEVTAHCETSFKDSNSVAICERSTMAGYSAADLMRSMNGSGAIHFNTPDPSQVSQTDDQHPAAQCRLDTYYSGALCSMNPPDFLDQSNPTVGVCALETGYKTGYRPLCWYKPQSGTPNPEPSPSPSPSPQPIPTDAAPSPTLSGQTSLRLNNPYIQIAIDYDVSTFMGSGATGAYVEVSAPNRDFSEPNGTQPDLGRWLWYAQWGLRGRFGLLPIRQLPGWGIYSVRVIALDASGTRAVGKFSTSAKLILLP